MTSLMAADMAEQPAVLRTLIAKRRALRETLRLRVLDAPRGIALVGRGSSENAARYARVLLELATRIPVTLVPPSMVRLYQASTDVSGFLVIGLSQSGRTPEIVETLERMRDDGALALAITADAGSPVAAAADVTVDLETGAERAVPATKSFVAEIAVLAMIAEALGHVPWKASAWTDLVHAVERALHDDDPVVRAASGIDGVSHLSVVAAGMSVGLAHEAALKIMEASGVAANAFSCESFRHGPISVGNPVVGLAVPGAAYDETIGLCASLDDVPTVVVGGPEIPLPADLPEALGVIPAAVRAQQLALELARRRGANPDRPPRLEKVTVT